MLELLNIDALDQLVSRYPRFDVNNMTAKILYTSDASVVGGLGETIMQTRGGLAISFSQDNTKAFATSINTTLSPYKSLMIDIAAETVAFDDTVGRGLYPIVPDQSGVVWASSTRSGYYGIWKRTGAATWTNVLSDAAQGSMKYKPDGTLYYLSSTANWYLLANGTATLIAAPSGYYSIPSSQFLELPNCEGRANNDFIDGTGAVVPALGTLDINVVNVATGWYNPPISLPKRQIHIDSTYSLVALQPPLLPNGSTAPKVYLTLVNKVTQTQKFIGAIPTPTYSYATAMSSQTAFDIAPFFAKLENGLIKIYWLGVIAQGGGVTATTNLFGLLRTNIPYTADI